MLKIVHRKIMVVLRSFQHLEASVVSLEERQRLLLVVHAIPREGLKDIMRVLQFLERGERRSGTGMLERHAISFSKLPFECWSNYALDVDVELDFW